MAIRDFFEGLASLFLMFAKIILCLLLAVFDRLISAGSDRGSSQRPTAGETSPVALKT